ncbi:MAG: peptidoglycan DD-metalloendopeptidase family protein [Gammaproteobacteria bacterium]|nr:peptidoglycan DD-metalloendopeptidase family protein [Gammaproteobacteria bacterium]
MHNQEIIIDPPVSGNWVIYNPPGHPAVAFDFLAEDEKKSLYSKGSFLRHLVSFISVGDTYTWTSPIYSPIDGVVVDSHGVEKDRKKISFIYDLFSLLINKPKESEGFGMFGGNYITIKSGDFYVLLCHLKEGSVNIKKGDVIRSGQQIAEAGNSGSSIQPHLHIQVMKNGQYFPLFKNLLPFKISSGKIKEGDIWAMRKNINLKNKTHYLFESA